MAHKDTEMMGHHISWLYPAEDNLRITLRRELKRAAAESHFGNNDWQIKKDGPRFRGNVHTVALKSEQGELQGFARVVRDNIGRHRADEMLRRASVRLKATAAGTSHRRHRVGRV
jgi:hypothetical protein